MPVYSVVGADTNTASTTQLYFVNGASSPKRLVLSEVLLGSDAIPQDYAAEFQIKRITDEHASPGGTAITPKALDSADPAAQSNAVEGPTGEPTYESGSHLLEIPLNQRATLRWIAQPGKELKCAATEDYGFGLFTESVTTAFSTNCTMIYEE